MSTKVKLHIESKSKEQHVQQAAEGESFSRGGHLYIRYPETDPSMGSTMTTVKININKEASQPVIKVLRHGNVQSEQTFELHKNWPGYYVTPYIRMDMMTFTQSIEHDISGGVGTIAWTYELNTGSESLGSYELKIHIQEVQH